MVIIVIVMIISTMQHTNNTDLRIFVYLNLAVAYMKIGDEKREAVTPFGASLFLSTASE